MIRSILSLAVFSLAVGMFVCTATAADKASTSSHDGTVVSASNGRLVMTGSDKKEHSHDVAATAKITVNGKAGRLEDLKKGMMVTVTTDKNGKVTAISSTSKAEGKTSAKRPTFSKTAKASK